MGSAAKRDSKIQAGIGGEDPWAAVGGVRAVLVVNEWNIDRPLFLKVGSEREREGIGSGKRCQDASSVDDRHHTHTHTHRQSRQHSHAQLPDSQNSAACWVCPAFVTGRRVPGSTIWLPLD